MCVCYILALLKISKPSSESVEIEKKVSEPPVKPISPIQSSPKEVSVPKPSETGELNYC